MKTVNSSATPISPSIGNAKASKEDVIFAYSPLAIIIALFLVILFLIALGLCIRVIQLVLVLCAHAGRCCRECCTRRGRVVVWPVNEPT